MSDPSAPSLAADVTAALAAYDASRAPDALRHAADVLVRDDGMALEPPAALAEAHTRLRLWLALLARFHRDLDADFDPNNPPSRTITAPVIDGEQVPPWVGPEDIADPVARKRFADAIAANERRVAQFTVMFKLDAVHRSVLAQAAASLRDARDTLGLPPGEIAAALDGADLLAADRAALRAAVAP